MGTRKEIETLRKRLDNALDQIDHLQKHHAAEADRSLAGFKLDRINGENVWYECECGCKTRTYRNIFSLSQAEVKLLVDHELLSVELYLDWLETKKKLDKAEGRE